MTCRNTDAAVLQPKPKGAWRDDREKNEMMKLKTTMATTCRKHGRICLPCSQTALYALRAPGP